MQRVKSFGRIWRVVFFLLYLNTFLFLSEEWRHSLLILFGIPDFIKSQFFIFLFFFFMGKLCGEEYGLWISSKGRREMSNRCYVYKGEEDNHALHHYSCSDGVSNVFLSKECTLLASFLRKKKRKKAQKIFLLCLSLTMWKKRKR